MLPGRGVEVLAGLEHGGAVGVGSRRHVHGRVGLGLRRHGALRVQRHLWPVAALESRERRASEVDWRRLRPGVLVRSIWSHTVKLQSDAGRARPRVGRGCVTLDLSPTTSLARSHNWAAVSTRTVSGLVICPYPSVACGDCARRRTHSLRNQSASVSLDHNSADMNLAPTLPHPLRRVIFRRLESEGVHLRALRGRLPLLRGRRIVGHVAESAVVG